MQVFRHKKRASDCKSKLFFLVNTSTIRMPNITLKANANANANANTCHPMHLQEDNNIKKAKSQQKERKRCNRKGVSS